MLHRRFALSLMVLLFLTASAAARVSVSEVTADGAWCWFSDPRCLCDGYRLITGWMTRDGDLEAASYDLLTGQCTVTMFEGQWEADDHDHPSFVQLSDGRYALFYCWHAVAGTYPLYRVSLAPGDVEAWSTRQTIPKNSSGSGGATYGAPCRVPGQQNRYHVFWRGGDWKPTMSTGAYNPQTGVWIWSDAWKVITVTTGRPYVKYVDDHGERIGIAFTDGHPDATDNNVYYAEVRDDAGVEAFFRADGTRIKTFGDIPLARSECDTVFDRTAAPDVTGDNAWVWDVAYDADGAPVVAYATFPSKRVHQYHWARFNGVSWDDATLVYDSGGSVADTTIYPKQYYYSGGLALDPRDPTTVYISHRHIYGGWDIDQWKTADGGETWSVVEITQNDPMDNLRPVVPANVPADYEIVLWMHGQYDHYVNDIVSVPPEYRFDTSILMWTNQLLSDVEAPVGAVASLANAPNPFTERTALMFDLARACEVDLVVYDVTGRRVRTLMDGDFLPPGRHEVTWDGRDDGGRHVASGVYFARAQSDEFALVRRVTLVQ